MDDTSKAPAGPWRKASVSVGDGGCFELAPSAGGGVLLRDTKDKGTGPILHFPRDVFATFLQGCTSGEFDDLAG